ncbi:MAG: hypothetical protein KJO98_02885, partial [Rhodothermia bacterium]|nr:hypothetical protein [Rhodothermia bacterium]
SLITGDLPDGSYRTVLSKGGSRYRIESQGRMNDSRSMPIVWKIYAEYERNPTATATDVPPFLDYALLSNGGLELAGSPDVELAAFADAENANVHTNGSLKVTGNNVNVSGFGTHTKGASSNPSGALETSFSPQENELDRPSVFEVPEIEIPQFSVDAYIDNVVPDMVSGPTTLSGEYNLGGTKEDPFVWVINGDLDATGGTAFNGYVMFMVEGNINMSGNVEGGMAAEGSTESTMAFYASGNINFSGNVEIFGQFFADGDFRVTGTPTVYGSVTTRGTAQLQGTPNMNYVKASPALAQIWNDGDPDLYTLVSYHEARDRIAEDKSDLFVDAVD